MARLTRISALAFAFGVLTPLVSVSAQSPTTAVYYDYDAIGPLPQSRQIPLWARMTAENKADIIRTKVLRWAIANRARLTPPQERFLLEAAAGITSDMYTNETKPENDARRKAMDARSRELFTTRGEWIEAFSFEGGGYIAPITPQSN
jgi:hypothetical protein